MRRRWCVISLLLLFGATPTQAGPATHLPVVASFSILADFVRNIGGDHVEVTTLVGANSDAHAYQPSPTDARALREARLVVVNGLGFEGWIDRLVVTSKTRALVVVASQGVTPRHDEDAHEGIDPHAWQAVANAKIYVANIRDGLIAADPDAAEAYRANANSYLARLAALETHVLAAIEKIPPDRRKIITTHDAFGYFGAAYGLDFIAPEGVATEAEPSARDVSKVIRLVKAQRIPAVFMENISDPRTMRRIAAESGARIGGTLFSDALSRSDGPAPSYIEMMRHNVKELAAALAP